MRAFIILGFLAAAASAANLGVGYNYGPGVSGIKIGKPSTAYVASGSLGSAATLAPVQTVGTVQYGSVAPVQTVGTVQQVGYGGSSGSLGYGSSIGNVGSVGSLGSSGSLGYGSSIGSVGSVGSSGSLGYGGSLGLSGSGSISNNAGSAGGVFLTGGQALHSAPTTVIGLDALDSIPQTIEYNKQIYYFEAPEEQHNEGQVTKQLSNVLKKNLQVVFVKAPEGSAATNAAFQLAKQAIEQRTAIYVLSKESDENQVVGQLQQIQEAVQHTPEVTIIKYRTAQDLANAQANIQSQYDSFGGNVPIINGGVVPVLNYASPAAAGSVNIIGGSGLSGGNYVSKTGSVGGSGTYVSNVGSLGSGLVSGTNNIGSYSSLSGSSIPAISGRSAIEVETTKTVGTGNLVGGTTYTTGLTGGLASGSGTVQTVGTGKVLGGTTLTTGSGLTGGLVSGTQTTQTVGTGKVLGGTTYSTGSGLTGGLVSGTETVQTVGTGKLLGGTTYTTGSGLTGGLVSGSHTTQTVGTGKLLGSTVGSGNLVGGSTTFISGVGPTTGTLVDGNVETLKIKTTLKK